jgi:hypothetical protein
VRFYSFHILPLFLIDFEIFGARRQIIVQIVAQRALNNPLESYKRRCKFRPNITGDKLVTYLIENYTEIFPSNNVSTKFYLLL